MPEVVCTECDWSGDFSELVSDTHEDSDGDLVGDHINACPECYAQTVDVHDADPADFGDRYDS